MDTKKAEIIPINKIITSKLVKTKPNFKSFNKLAPAITGIARKNVNSAATSLEVPSKIAPNMVAPEREVPGIKARTSRYT